MADVDFSTLVWIEKADSPFGVRCLDCRKFASSITTFTADPRIGERFSNPPDPLGKEYPGHLPDRALTVSCDLAYGCKKKAEEGPLVFARVMEDKWNIHRWGGYLYFSRSWTGQLVFRMKAEFTGEQILVSEICADQEPASSDQGFIVRQADYLIKSLLLGLEVPHPLPPDLPDDVQSIGAYSFSRYGRWAAFATYEDTQRVPGRTRTEM